GRTFAAALERQAVRAQLITADRRGELEDTEDQLFRFARLVESNPELRNVLGDRAVGLSRRQELVGGLLSGRATDASMVLAKRAVAARERTFDHTIEGYVTLAAAHKNRVAATVRVARPLSSDQRNRLRDALRNKVGREVAIQEVIDPDILGGVRVELGDEVFEGTVSDRLESARRLFG
ncbi:MAG TPA: ATP synthase F1 subunit delta, partial [Propionibacteriaceae bacterium]